MMHNIQLSADKWERMSFIFRAHDNHATLLFKNTSPKPVEPHHCKVGAYQNYQAYSTTQPLESPSVQAPEHSRAQAFEHSSAWVLARSSVLLPMCLSACMPEF